MPTRQVRALIQSYPGNGKTRQFPSTHVEGFAVDSALDTDADAFSVELGNPFNDVNFTLDRDTEIRISLYTSFGKSQVQALGSGFADVVMYDTSDGILSIAGRDYSAVATDTQAKPFEIKHVKPKKFIELAAGRLGFPSTQIAQVSELNKLYTDGSETEWALMYRIAREKKMWLWCEPTGKLVMDQLHYSAIPIYSFGNTPRGDSSPWIPVERLTFTSSKQGRLGESWVYVERGDVGFRATYKDEKISSWRRKNLRIQQSSKAKTYAEGLLEAQEEIFESIVGAQEIQITIPDPGYVIRQNNMARLNLPGIDIGGMWFITGVTMQGSQSDGYTQVIRLREKGYAVNNRVPEEPSVTQDTGQSDSTIVGSTVGTELEKADIRWGSAFVSAAREFGVANGWDFATFLGALLAICKHETKFTNVRNNQSGLEWYPEPTSVSGQRDTSEHGRINPGEDVGPLSDLREKWLNLWANKPGNPRIPVSTSQDSHARQNGLAVGPMQLLTEGYKVWADEYAGKSGEYDGGRWQPEANIRAAGRALLSKAHGLDPNKIENIWAAVGNYYGSSPENNIKYGLQMKKSYEDNFASKISAGIESGATLPAGTQTKITFPSGDTYEAPKNTPDTIKKAINWAFKRLGDPYKWGGAGPLYDCSSFAAGALVYGGVTGINGPNGSSHGDDTKVLLTKGRLVAKDELLPGDLVFFSSGEHMGLYLGKNLFIHDPHTGDVVKISGLGLSYYMANYYQGRRYFEWPAIDQRSS